MTYIKSNKELEKTKCASMNGQSRNTGSVGQKTLQQSVDICVGQKTFQQNRWYLCCPIDFSTKRWYLLKNALKDETSWM